MKKIFIVTVSAVLSMNAFAQKKIKSPLEGRIYAITMTEENKKKAEPFKDDLTFVPQGKFKSTFMLGAGFQPSDYEYEVDSTTSPVTIKFTVEAKNDSQERFSWEGTVTDDKTEGTAIIRKKGKIEHTYTFSGTWKNKKKVKPVKPAPAAPVADSTQTPPPPSPENPQ